MRQITVLHFTEAITHTLGDIFTTHAADIATLMTLKFQQLENVSLMAA